MKLAVAVFFTLLAMSLQSAEIPDISLEMWQRVRGVGASVIGIDLPGTVQAPESLSMAQCFALALRYNAAFRQEQKSYIDARGRLWVAQQQMFYTATGNTGYQTTAGANVRSSLFGDFGARWEQLSGSEFRATVGLGSQTSLTDFLAEGPSVSLAYDLPLSRGVGISSAIAERIRSAKSALFTRELTFFDAYQNLALDIIVDYSSVLLAQGEVAIAERSVERARQIYDINFAKFTGEGIALPGEEWVSQVAEIDVDQARLSWERAKQQLLSRKQTYQDTLDRLLLTMGVTPGGNPRLTSVIEYDPQDYDEAALVETALANSTELGRLTQAWGDLLASNRLAIEERKPNIIATVGVHNIGSYANNADVGATISTGVRVEFPVKRRAVAEDIEREARALMVMEHRILITRDTVAQEVQRLVRALSSSRQRIEIGEQSLALARKSRDAAQGMYDEGLNDYLRVLNAEDRLVEAERSLLQEQVQYFLTEVRLRRAVGELIAEGLPNQ